MPAETSREKIHALHGLPKYYIDANQYSDLVELIDGGEFIIHKAEILGIETLSEDLEQNIIPEVIMREDWQHFAHYITLDLNIRGLAEELCQEIIIKALVRNGQIDFARHIISQNIDPHKRAVARAAMLANTDNQEESYSRYLDQTQMEEDLLEAANNLHGETLFNDFAKTLTRILANLGAGSYPTIKPFISILIDQNSQEIDHFWIAVAKTLRNDLPNNLDNFWQSLQRIKNKELLSGEFSLLLDNSHAINFDFSLGQLIELKLSPNLLVEAFFILIDLVPAEVNVDTWKLFKNLVNGRISDFDFHQVDPKYLSIFLSTLSHEQIQSLIAQLNPINAKLAVAITANKNLLCSIVPDQMLEWIYSLPDSSVQLHWLLRFASLKSVNIRDILPQIKSATLASAFSFYDQKDVVSFLHLLLENEPSMISRYLDLIAYSKFTKPEILFVIASRNDDHDVLEFLVDRIEKYVGEFSSSLDETELFTFRRKLLLELVYASCCLENISCLNTIVEHKLFPPERDNLYNVVVRLVEDGKYYAAIHLLRYIDVPLLQFLARIQLKAVGVTIENDKVYEALEFKNLYALFVDTAAIEYELLAAEILCQHPAELKRIAHEKAVKIFDHNRRASLLIDLAKQNVEYQKREFATNKVQYQDVFEISQSIASLIQSQEDLLLYTPDIVLLASQEKTYKSMDEILEGYKRTIEANGISELDKFNVLLKLLSILRDLYINEFVGNQVRQYSSSKKMKKFFDDLVKLTKSSKNQNLHEQFEYFLVLIFPVLVAIFKGIDSSVLLNTLSHPWQASVAYDHLSLITMFSKSDKFFRFLVAFENRYWPSFLKNLNHSTWVSFSEFAGENFQSDHARIIQYSKETLNSEILLEDLAIWKEMPKNLLAGIAFICANSNPLLLPSLLDCMAEGELKDLVITRLLLDKWIPDSYRIILLDGLVSLMHDRNLADFICAWLHTYDSTFLVASPENEIRDLESTTVELFTTLEKSWVSSDVWRWIGDLCNSSKINLRDYANQVIFRIKQSGKLEGLNAFLLWIRFYIVPQYEEEVASTKKNKIHLIRDAINNAEEISPTIYKNISSTDNQIQLISATPNQYGKYKKWRNAISFRWDNDETIKKSLQSTGILIMMLYSSILLFFDLFLRGEEGVQHYIDIYPSPFFLVGLICIHIINMWLMTSLMKLRNDNRVQIRPAIKIMISIFSGLPFWGMYSISILNWISQAKPSWAILSKFSDSKTLPKSHLFSQFETRMIWLGNILWRRTWLWWGIIANMVITFLASFIFLDSFVLLGPAYHYLGIFISATLHIMVFLNLLGYFWFDAEQLELQGWRLWRKVSLSILWLIPIPGLAFAGLFIYIFTLTGIARQNTLTYQAFENVGKLSRDPIWANIKTMLEVDFKKMKWFRGVREHPYHNTEGQKTPENKTRQGLMMKLRAILTAGSAAWLVRGLFDLGISFDLVDRIMYFLVFGSLILGMVGLIGFIIRFIFTLAKRDHFLPDPPYFVYLYMSQFAVVSGATFAFGIQSEDPEFAVFFSLIGILLLGLKFIEIILSIFINIPQRRYEHSYEMVLWIFVLAAMAFLPVSMNSNTPIASGNTLMEAINSPEFTLGMLEFSFFTMFPLLTLAFVIATYNQIMKPFSLKDISNPSLPKKSRFIIGFIGISYWLPMGGIFIPLWIYLKEKFWVEFEKQLV